MDTQVEPNQIVVPGDVITTDKEAILGKGLHKIGDKAVASILGVLNVHDKKIDVRPFKGVYSPREGDMVVGLVVDAGLTSWRVDIGVPHDAILLGSNAVWGRFDPVTTDTRKIYAVGDMITAMVLSADRTRDPHLETKERGLGRLQGGRVIKIAPAVVARVIGRKASMISMLKEHTNTQVFVGQNGTVWVKGKSRLSELIVIDAIKQIEQEAHSLGLTDRVRSFLESKKDELKNAPVYDEATIEYEDIHPKRGQRDDRRGGGGYRRDDRRRGGGGYRRDDRRGGGGYRRDDRRSSGGGDRRSSGGYRRDDRRSSGGYRRDDRRSSGGYRRDDRGRSDDRRRSSGGDRRDDRGRSDDRRRSSGGDRKDDRKDGRRNSRGD